MQSNNKTYVLCRKTVRVLILHCLLYRVELLDTVFNIIVILTTVLPDLGESSLLVGVNLLGTAVLHLLRLCLVIPHVQASGLGGRYKHP